MRWFAVISVPVHQAIDPSVWLLALLSGVFLAAVGASGVSLLAVMRAKVLLREVAERAQAGQERHEALLESLRAGQSLLEAELREIRDQPAVTMVSGPLKPGLNLSTRSQALRMHRRGEPPSRIAAALDIPLQEVDLLLKVHRIVIGHM